MAEKKSGWILGESEKVELHHDMFWLFASLPSSQFY